MKKISIKNVVEFQRKSSDNSRATLLNRLKKVKPAEEAESGGDYWIHSLSAISSAFANDDNDLIFDKIDIIRDKVDASPAKISRDMFLRNIDILHNFEEVEFSDMKPKLPLQYLSKPKDKSILLVRGVPIQVLPHHVFTFKEKGVDTIGAIWFVSKLGGYSDEELAMFTDALFRYLKEHYSKAFALNPDFCSTVDVTTLNEVTYAQIANKSVKSALNSTLDSISKML